MIKSKFHIFKKDNNVVSENKITNDFNENDFELARIFNSSHMASDPRTYQDYLNLDKNLRDNYTNRILDQVDIVYKFLGITVPRGQIVPKKIFVERAIPILETIYSDKKAVLSPSDEIEKIIFNHNVDMFNTAKNAYYESSNFFGEDYAVDMFYSDSFRNFINDINGLMESKEMSKTFNGLDSVGRGRR